MSGAAYRAARSGGTHASATAIHVDAGTFDTGTPVDLAEDVFNTANSGTVDAGPMAMTAGADRTTIAFGFGDGTGSVTQSDGGGFSTPVISNWTSRWIESFTSGGGRASFWADSVEYTGTDAALRWSRATDEWGTIIFAVEPVGVAAATPFKLAHRTGFISALDREIRSEVTRPDADCGIGVAVHEA